MKKVTENIWGPGPTAYSQTLLAVAGSEISDEDYERFTEIAARVEALNAGNDGDESPDEMTIDALTEYLEEVDDIDDLTALNESEAAGKNRDGALAAIAARVEALGATNDG